MLFQVLLGKKKNCARVLDLVPSPIIYFLQQITKEGKQSSSEVVSISETIFFSADCTVHMVPAHPGTSTCSCWPAPNPNYSQKNKMKHFTECLGDAAFVRLLCFCFYWGFSWAVAAPNDPRRDFTQGVNTVWWLRTLMVWRDVLSCRCFAGLIPIGFGLVCVRNWNWMGISLLQMVPWQKSLV